MNTITSKSIISLFLIITSLLSTQAISDTINASQIFRDNGETMVSSGGTFELGFFSPENSRNRYVGIWYKKITVQTVVWVANRDIPITETSSGTLRVIDPGLLVLVNDTNGIIWSTNTSRTVQNPVAQLLDSGNLVVRDANDDNPENFLWESFNYPTNTFLPRMKLGRNFRTGLEVYIRSWRSNSDPASGDYTYHCDPTGYPQNILKRGESVQYRSGPWNGQGASGAPSLRRNPIFRFGLVMNKDEVYYHYELLNDSVITRFTLSESGVGQRYSNSWFNTSMSLEECRVLCSRNCSCMAYTNLDITNGGSGCLLWFGDLVDMREVSPGQDIYIRMASSELDSGGRKREILIVTLSVVIGIVLLSLSVMLYYRKRKKLDREQRETGRPRFDYVDNHTDESHNKSLELPLFDLSTLTKATDDFSINNKLGEGGFGPVYKGLLEEGQEIAVKRLSTTSHQGVDELKNEVICTAKLQHRNLIRKSILLDWPERLNIINGIARGLMYLHQDSRLRVIHRDLKASNILLDSDMNPKISDFGLARIFGGNETGANTSRVWLHVPEYAIDGVFSVKSDVFSFGVLVLEIVSGKKNRGFSHKNHSHNLLGHAWMLYKEERSLELVDSDLRNSCYLLEVLRSIHIGLLCVQELPEDRPTMSSVVLMLSNEGVLPQAKHPGFFTGRNTFKTESSVSSVTASSTNEMTITLLQAR
ncbi:hypothetical protein DH2020_008546 [Rehmannia glutinosa]|uniref:Receptor-like serine/threonine-protein kinase n=1 Tax=Rehmannia glutinosa TaxID=99300 RepID=A0ABR0X3R1_REHGL